MTPEDKKGISPGQAEVNLIRLRMKIEEDKKQSAKERVFKEAEDKKWELIKKERARKKRMRETKGKG